jgi:hypothetical protein
VKPFKNPEQRREKIAEKQLLQKRSELRDKHYYVIDADLDEELEVEDLVDYPIDD